MNPSPFKSQQILQLYNSKMHILTRVLFIICLGVITTLVFFDYDFSEAQLNLSSNANCVELGLTNKHYLCNTCFKVSSKNKTNEQIIVESQTPFLLVSLKEEISSMLSCEEWLQAVDYEDVFGEDHSARQVVRLEPTVNKFLASLSAQYNEISLVQRSQSSNQQLISSLKQYSSLERPYQILSYYSKTNGTKPFRIYLTNDLIKSQSVHILTLLVIAAAFAVFYSFQCTKSKEIIQKYKENVFSLVAIFGTFVWILLGDLGQNYDLYIAFCKILFFSLSLGIIFGAARQIFLGICTIVYALIALQHISPLYRSFIQIALFFIVLIRMCNDIKNEYYHMEKNSNKKVFFLIMTLLVVGCSTASFIEDDSTLGQILKFQQTFLMMVSFLIGIKNLDGDTYNKMLNEHNKKQSQSLGSFDSPNDIYEDHEALDETQLKQFKK